MLGLKIVLLLGILVQLASSKGAPACVWDSKRGASFDVRSLTVGKDSQTAYRIVDGDIPCTPEKEPAYGYVWNFCDAVPTSQVPVQCKNMGKSGVVLQYAQYSADDYYCYILGHYDAQLHEITYDLLDPTNPSKGVTMRYPAGEKCSSTNKKTRSAVIEVECANVESVVTSAQEPEVCEYHLHMKSYYGCPKECPITSNGLCNSHGHCAYDSKAKKSYCYCNSGYSGSACNVKGSSTTSTTYDGYSVQIGLLATLLCLALILTGGVVYLAYRVAEFRKEQISSHYSSLPAGDTEMVETVHFK